MAGFRRLAILQETLFIIRNANLFRTTAGEVYQVAWASSRAELAFACPCSICFVVAVQIIDTDKATLQNVIVFPPKGAFVIETKIEQSGDQRVTFEFEKAILKLPKRDIKLPPYGKGWSVTWHAHVETLLCMPSSMHAPDKTC